MILCRDAVSQQSEPKVIRTYAILLVYQVEAKSYHHGHVSRANILEPADSKTHTPCIRKNHDVVSFSSLTLTPSVPICLRVRRNAEGSITRGISITLHVLRSKQPVMCRKEPVLSEPLPYRAVQPVAHFAIVIHFAPAVSAPLASCHAHQEISVFFSVVYRVVVLPTGARRKATKHPLRNERNL